MIVTVITVGVMQPSVHDVIDMVAVGHGFVAATRAVNVPVLMSMPTTGAPLRILFRHGENMLLDRTIVVLVMKMAIVEIIDVTVMTNRGVSTTFSVLVVVLLL